MSCSLFSHSIYMTLQSLYMILYPNPYISALLPYCILFAIHCWLSLFEVFSSIFSIQKRPAVYWFLHRISKLPLHRLKQVLLKFCAVYLHAHNVVPARKHVRNHLNAVFPGRWIGRGGPISWPTRSLYLNPHDFFLWEYIKSLAFETSVETDMEIVARIVGLTACNFIQNTTEIFVKVRQNLVRRYHACIEVGGRQFEQLL